ncbi:MAG TPA: hypothetical protein VM682_07625, partial [Bacillus sp. (in: firmicutes)]|nr:hypothetical protein [Bacillus sp. (in: firmicutes)]
ALRPFSYFVQVGLSLYPAAKMEAMKVTMTTRIRIKSIDMYPPTNQNDLRFQKHMTNLNCSFIITYYRKTVNEM